MHGGEGGATWRSLWGPAVRGRQKRSVQVQAEFRGLIENAENLKNIESAKRDLGGESVAKRERHPGGVEGRPAISFPLELNLPFLRQSYVPGTERRPRAFNIMESPTILDSGECKFIIRKANWGQLVTIYDINTKYLCPVVIYALAYKKRLRF